MYHINNCDLGILVSADRYEPIFEAWNHLRRKCVFIKYRFEGQDEDNICSVILIELINVPNMSSKPAARILPMNLVNNLANALKNVSC